MFLIMMKYKQPLEIVDQYLARHRDFLAEGYKKDFFVVSGPQNPRTGGVIISQIKNREQLEALVKQDPFIVNQIADYEIIEFTPVKYHHNFANFVE